ncbi:MAG: hypothetical protein ABJ360_22530 [Roseobacter sp.]
MPLVEFVGQSVQDQGNAAVSTSRLINCYREMVLGSGKTQYVINNVLGQDLLDDLGAEPVRAFGQGNGQNWAVGNNKLFVVAGDGTVTDTGQVIADDEVSVVSGNYSDVTVTAGGNYYLWDGATLSQPDTKAFTNIKSHFYFGGYTVLLEDGGKRFQWSGLGDASTLDALDFSSAEKSDDNLVRGFEIQGTAVLFCETSAEMWQLSGAAGATAFQFVTSWRRGLKAHNLAVQFDDSLFFVGNDNNVYLGVGPGAVDITTPAINSALEANTATHCFYYEDRGHKFCVLRFSDRAAWVYDVKMREWHERAEGPNNGAWQAITSMRGDTWQVGSTDGEIFSLSRSGRDLNAPLRRTMISNNYYIGSSKFRVQKIEINARVGEEMLNEAIDFVLSTRPGYTLLTRTDFALQTRSLDGDERAGFINLSVSRDGGRTWGDAKPRSLGLGGDYEKRMVWRSVGQAQQFAIKIEMNEPADFQVNSTAVFEVV